MKAIQYSAITLLLLGCLAGIFFSLKIISDGYWLWGNETDFPVTGNVGNFVGGVIGTIFALVGTLFIILYYNGHQHRLSHYFRHLFQSYKYLNSQKNLPEKEKYFYAKMLRAQLSTYEQALLFVNSLSSSGMNWELDSTEKLITKFNLIKNLPDYLLPKINYKRYYPAVKYG